MLTPELVTDVHSLRHWVQDGAHLRWAVWLLCSLAGGLRSQIFQQGWLHLRAACFLPVGDCGSNSCLLGWVRGCRFQLGLKRVHQLLYGFLPWCERCVECRTNPQWLGAIRVAGQLPRSCSPWGFTWWHRIVGTRAGWAHEVMCTSDWLGIGAARLGWWATRIQASFGFGMASLSTGGRSWRSLNFSCTGAQNLLERKLTCCS